MTEYVYNNSTELMQDNNIEIKIENGLNILTEKNLIESSSSLNNLNIDERSYEHSFEEEYFDKLVLQIKNNIKFVSKNQQHKKYYNHITCLTINELKKQLSYLEKNLIERNVQDTVIRFINRYVLPATSDKRIYQTALWEIFCFQTNINIGIKKFNDIIKDEFKLEERGPEKLKYWSDVKLAI